MRTWILAALLLGGCHKQPATQGAAATHFPERPSSPDSVDVYLDGKRVLTLSKAELGEGKPLQGLVAAPVRSALIHGEIDKWLREPGAMELSLNKRGLIKVGPKGGGGGGGVRDVRWLELRSLDSPRLPDEP